MMIAAVTGANGFIGTNLVRLLLNRGYEVRSLIHNGQTDALQGLKTKMVEGNLQDTGSLETLCKGASVVFHLAAKISIGDAGYKSLYETNVLGTQKVFLAAQKAGVETFVHFSSIHAFKQESGNRSCDERCALAVDSEFDYDKTKALAQQWIAAQKGNGMKVMILNPTAVLGPFDFKPSLLGAFVLKTMKRQLPGLINGGYDWVDVRDVVHAAVNAVTHGEDGESYILSGEWLSLKELTRLMGEVSGVSLNPVIYPVWLVQTALPLLKAWAILTKSRPLYTSESLKIVQAGSQNIQSGKAKSALGFTNRPLKETLADTIQWFKENGYIQ